MHCLLLRLYLLLIKPSDDKCFLNFYLQFLIRNSRINTHTINGMRHGKLNASISRYINPSLSYILAFTDSQTLGSVTYIFVPQLFIRLNFSHDSRPRYRKTARCICKDTCCIVQIASSERDSYTWRRKNIG
jgi:hypothetical protein